MCHQHHSVTLYITLYTGCTAAGRVQGDVQGVQDDVTHIIGSMCVVQQSTVLIPCKYIHPQHEQLSSVEWLHEKSPEEEVRVSQDPAFEGRVEFVQSDARNCSLILRDVRKSDAGIFRLVHNTASGQIRMNAQGIRLDVTDAEVEVQTESDNVTEGDWILFICGSCIPSVTATYIWRKDGRLHSRHHGENLLYLESVGLEDRGRYLCTISGHEGLNSTSVDITVRPVYPPKNVSVSVSRSGVIVEGDSVTLNCISDSNPPAEISWIKGGMILQSGDTYSITNIKSEASGNYYCSARNKHRSLNSSAVTVNVMCKSTLILDQFWMIICSITECHLTLFVFLDPPKSVSVSVSPSGVIVEGDSVTLNCISDSNPPAEISWIKGGTIVGSGRIFSISNISSDHSGEYKCRSRNKHGEKDSEAVKLNVMYRPRNVSVSVSRSGVIVEGDSVTLNCISDSNPPAEISWIKGGMILQSGDTYSITNIKSEASGNYYCSARNKHGSRTSSAVTVNVMYPPKSVSVSVSPPSGVIVEGDSLTLNCISDSNPPALNFSWFKENETSAVGSGQSFSISSFNSSFSGRFYCEAQNKYGSQRSASVSLTVKESSWSSVTVGITASVVVTVILMLVLWLLIRRKRVTPSEERNHRGSRRHKTVRQSSPASSHVCPVSYEGRIDSLIIVCRQVESPEDAYMTLDPKSRCSEYDTLDGSTTLLSGTYKHPDRVTVTEAFWTVNPVKDENRINLLDLLDYRGRVEYLPIKDKNFVLKLSNVRREDEGMYCIRILTKVERERYLGYPGIQLNVTELRVEIPEEVVEKDSPVLLCKSTCNLSERTDFFWYKNGESLSESSVGNRLILRSVSSDDTGNYSCAARDQEHLPSPAVTLSVRYPPKSVSVSVSPSGVIVEGDSVTLNCISDSNPPALNFSWFKENETSAVGSGQSFSISSFNSSFSGRFYCEAQNKYGSRRSVSLFVSATVAGVQNTGVYAAAGIGAVLIGICIIVVVITILRKRVTPSEERNHRGSRHHKTVESPENAYMTLDPKSRCSEYDTLDNMKRSCDTDNPEDQDTTYYNMDK
ncbi:unnamed protein product [Leuciscus chuanchicus]